MIATAGTTALAGTSTGAATGGDIQPVWSPDGKQIAYAGLAGIADRQGDPRKAATLARKALSEDATNAAAQDVLARVTA